jgi:hypothetical protein
METVLVAVTLGVKLLADEANHFPHSSAEARSTWICNSTPPHVPNKEDNSYILAFFCERQRINFVLFNKKIFSLKQHKLGMGNAY